jgi:signal transduction histidine kinase
MLDTPKIDTSEGKNIVALDKALDSTKSGFVIMKYGKILYANSAAPIYIDTEGNKSLKLMFSQNDNLEKWLEDCQKSAVSAEKIWTRIPNGLPEEENCKYYDVLATFSRDSDYEVVLTLIDRTSIYAVSEEALNFIAFAAHELRGPITVIKGYLDVLEDELGPTLDDDHNMLIGRLKVSANRLSTYINNILNTSRYDRRHLKLRLAEEKLVDVYDVIKEDMSLRASSQNRFLSVSILPNLPTIAADKNSLSEVFANLIDNAIKYSSEGGTISVEAVAKENNVEISVSDNGIGMPESVVENLFQKFFRSHRSRETVAGTGIGLYISKAIVESHGGKIKVDSIEGKGSKFTVILPVYSAVEKNLSQNKDSNENIISENKDQIKNHSMYRG